MAVAPAVAKPVKVSIVKREPVLIGGAIIGVLESIVVLLPTLGIQIPAGVQTALGAFIAISVALGVQRPNARPAALSVPSPLAKAQDAAKAGLGSGVAPNKVSPVVGAIAGAITKLKPKGK